MNGNAAQLLYGLWAGGFLLAMSGALLVLLRFRVKLFAPLSLLIIAILVHSPFATVPAKASAAERASAAATTGQQPQPTAVSFDPRVAPEQQSVAGFLPPAGTVQAPSDSSGVSNSRSRSTRADTIVDSDGDGLSDDQEALIGSDRTKIDTDNDGLSDPQEVQLGTSLTLADTDNDGITDYVEARIPTLNLDTTKSLTPTTLAAIQTQLYTNPLDDDTNSDGLVDGVECPQHMILDNTSVVSSITDCSDADGDKTPDFLSNDNDGDGIVDNADFDSSTALYGNATTKAGFSDTNPFALRFDGLTPGKPLVVDIQFRPTNPRLLSLNGSVYDWPSSDTAGQIQRTKDTTFAAPKDAAITAMSDVNAANGDMQVSAMLELRVPVSATSFGALPVKPGARWSSATTGVPAWLDTTKTAPYGINAVWDNTGTNVVLTIPVRPITDENGSVVSFAATTYFESQSAEWVTPAKMRLIWLVSMIQDDCPPNLGNCTTAQRVQSFAPVQMYSSEYMVAGISAKEHLGYTAAIVTDDTLSSLQTSTNPYLFITQAKSLITNSFVDDGYLSLTNTSQPTRALDQLLSGTRNQTDPIKTTATRYGITPGTTNIQTFSYATDVASILVRSNDLTNVLNATACRTSASVTSCGTEANKTAVLNTCKTDTTSLRCNPAVIITDESRTRTATLLSYETTGAVSFKESEVVTNRTVEAGFYSVAADGKWTSNADVQLGTIGIRIQQNIVATSTTYTDISNDTVALLNDAAGVSFVATFMSQSASTFYSNDLVNAQAVPTYTPTVVPAINTWSGYQSNMLTTYQSGIAKVIALAKYSSNDKPAFELPANLESCTICKGMTALASTIYKTYTNNQKTVAEVKLGFNSTNYAIKIAKSIYSVYSFVSDYRKVQNVIKTLKTARVLLLAKRGAAG
ncbi:MAG: thrombospondin type 3 repeat-containing protein, partial [Roseiflexaceae bacterium]